jgi:hypothetical protein
MVVCCGFVIAVAILKAAWAQRERESLTSSDLTALEESAVILIDQLKTEVDAGIAEIDARRADLARLIDEADRRLIALERYGSIVVRAEMPATPESVPEEATSESDLRRRKAVELAACGLGDAADIARASGIGAAEANLMLRLAKQKHSTING